MLLVFGLKKTSSTANSIGIIPLQVLLTAMFVSAVCKKLDDGHDDIDDDEKDPELQPDEEWMHVPRESPVQEFICLYKTVGKAEMIKNRDNMQQKRIS